MTSKRNATDSGESASRPAVTRDDVARYAGVSPAVVSYVVNAGPRGVAPEKREKVLGAIRALGYRPNTFARALRMGSTKTFGLVIPDVSNPLFAEIAQSVEAAASAAGFAVILTNSAGNKATEKEQLQNLLSRRVDGVIMVSPVAQPDVSELLEFEMPIAFLNGFDEHERVSSIGIDLYHGARLGVEHLIAHGHKSIALIMGNNGLRGSLDRERGWLHALRDAGLREGPLVPVPFSREGGYEAGQRLLQSTATPTAVFVSSDLQSIGALRAFHEAGIDVPRDMAMVSFDGSLESEYTWPPLTVVRQPVQQLATEAVAALLRPAGHEARSVTCFGELIARASCGCGSDSSGRLLDSHAVSHGDGSVTEVADGQADPTLHR